MSTCISRHGEYGSHDLTATGAERFVCQRCFALDEDAIIEALDAAQAAALQTAIETAAIDRPRLVDIIAAALCDQAERAEAEGGESWWSWSTDDVSELVADAVLAVAAGWGTE